MPKFEVDVVSDDRMEGDTVTVRARGKVAAEKKALDETHESFTTVDAVRVVK